MARQQRIVQTSADDAEYLGDDDNGCYYQTARTRKGWYVSIWVDCEHFSNEMYVDHGPYATNADALAFGRHVAEGWCLDNDVFFDFDEEGL